MCVSCWDTHRKVPLAKNSEIKESNERIRIIEKWLKRKLEKTLAKLLLM